MGGLNIPLCSRWRHGNHTCVAQFCFPEDSIHFSCQLGSRGGGETSSLRDCWGLRPLDRDHPGGGGGVQPQPALQSGPRHVGLLMGKHTACLQCFRFHGAQYIFLARYHPHASVVTHQKSGQNPLVGLDPQWEVTGLEHCPSL